MDIDNEVGQTDDSGFLEDLYGFEFDEEYYEDDLIAMTLQCDQAMSATPDKVTMGLGSEALFSGALSSQDPFSQGLVSEELVSEELVSEELVSEELFSSRTRL